MPLEVGARLWTSFFRCELCQDNTGRIGSKWGFPKDSNFQNENKMYAFKRTKENILSFCLRITHCPRLDLQPIKRNVNAEPDLKAFIPRL